MLENGVLVWKTLEDIGAGDGNDNTTYEITALEKGEDGAKETYGIKIQVKENGVASGDPIEIPFDVYTKSEVDAAHKEIEDRVKALEDAEDADTTYSVKEGEKILKLEGTEFSTVASLKYVEATETAAAKIQLLGIDNTVVSEIDATPFIKDGMLHDVSYDAETNKLTFTWNTDEGEKTDEVILSDIIEPYTAGNGLTLSGNEFNVNLATGSENFLSVDSNGLKLSGVQEAINAAKNDAATDAQNKANQALADAKTDAANLYATRTYVGEFSKEGDYANVSTIVGYVNKKAEETLKAATGNTGETAESVALALSNYKQENDPKVQANTTAITTINEKLITIENNAEVNIIEVVKKNGVALEVNAEDRSVDIGVPTALTELSGWTALDERVTAAKTQADKGVDEAGKANAAAAANAEEIGKHATRIGALEAAKGDHETRIISLENADSQHASEYTALKGIVEGHTAALAGKAEQTSLDSVSARVAVNEGAIKTLNETTLPGINTEIGKKANSADVYTKTEVGTITEGKTLVQMIEDAKTAATYDDTAVKALITAEETRAKGIESGLDSRLTEVETFFAVVENPDEVIDTLAEIVNYIESDRSGAAAMAGNIQANTNAIAAINNVESGIFAQAKGYTDGKIDALPTSGPIAGALLGLVKSSNEDNKIKVEADGTMSLNRVSTNQLYIPEGSELILNGGSATD